MQAERGASVQKVSREEARLFLLGHLGLKRHGAYASVEEVLQVLRCIQVDSLDPMGYSHELVVMARIDGVVRGKMFHHLPVGSYFEHWAKERCILPASAFPYYYNNMQKKMKHWWCRPDREAKLLKLIAKGAQEVKITKEEDDKEEKEAEGTSDPLEDDEDSEADDQTKLQRSINRVLEEVREKGPQVNPRKLKEIGKVDAHDWNGWKGTKSATALTLEILWGECKVVITRGLGRDSKEKLFSIPHDIFPPEIVKALDQPITEEEFAEWAIKDRVEAAGLLPRSSGPHWSVLEKYRKSPSVDALLESGEIEEVQIEGSRCSYLAPKGWRERQYPDFDDRMRIIAPLDPIVWNRPLVQHVFDFEYVWEVYKKEEKRMWGWYVCPLLHKGRFVGRIEGKIEGDALVIKNVWKEEERSDGKSPKRSGAKGGAAKGSDGTNRADALAFDEDAFRAMLRRHAELCGVSDIIINGQPLTDELAIVYSRPGQTDPAQVTSKKPAKKKRKASEEEEEEEEEDQEEEEEPVSKKSKRPQAKTKAKPVRQPRTRAATKKRKAVSKEEEEHRSNVYSLLN